MTVVLLQQVLRELNITFKASSSTKELILKVKEARLKIKDRSECCQANTYSSFSSSTCIAGSDRTGVFMLTALETDKRKRVWLFWASLHYLIAVLFLPVELNAICYCYSVFGLYCTLSELLIVAFLLIYQAQLELFSAICFKLAFVRLEDIIQFDSVGPGSEHVSI